MTEVSHVIELRRDAISRGLILNEQFMPDSRAGDTAYRLWGVGQFVIESNQGDITIPNATPTRVNALIAVAVREGGVFGEALVFLNTTASRSEINAGGSVRWSRHLPATGDRITLYDWLGENGF